MKKLLIRYIWLSILLLGYSQLHARQDVSVGPSMGISKDEACLCATSLHNSIALINYTAQHYEKQQETADLTQNENEEEELSIHDLHFFKKISVVPSHFLSPYPNAPGYFAEKNKQSQPSGRPFHSLSSRQYILFRVIRI